MAGTADTGRGLVLATGTPTAASRRALRARLAALPATAVALLLSGGAMALHYALWGSAAPWGRAELAGGVVAMAGLAWALWAAAVFRAARQPIETSAQPLQLIEEGPYRFGRHPMYLGIVLKMAGTALSLGIPLLGGATLLFAALAATVHVPHEEAQLARRFGGWYRDYAGAVRQWF